MIETFASSTTCQKVRSVTPEQCLKLIIDQLEQLIDKELLFAEFESLSTHATFRLAEAPGEFTALKLDTFMYVAFQRITPETDIGMDFSREYEAAVSLRK